MLLPKTSVLRVLRLAYATGALGFSMGYHRARLIGYLVPKVPCSFVGFVVPVVALYVAWPQWYSLTE